MTEGSRWPDYVEVLHPAVQRAAEILGELRNKLIARYDEVEKDHSSIDKNAGGNLYKTFGGKLRKQSGFSLATK